MSNKKIPKGRKTAAKKQQKKQHKKTSLPLILTAAAIVCAAVIAVIVGNVFRNESPNSADAHDIASGENLNILTADVGTTASFYPITVDGTEMEVLAIKASDGTIRTAFNTCQSCYASGAGYYVQEGDDLVCQNCGFHFTADEVEIQSGGCNPWPIFAENKTVTEDSIQISYDFLQKSSSIFANWKR